MRSGFFERKGKKFALELLMIFFYFREGEEQGQ